MNTDQTNLIDKITSILARQGHKNPTFWSNHELILTAKNSGSKQYERLYVNRYWRQYLGNLQVNTLTARFCLDDNEAEKTYLNYFESIVAPVIVSNQN